MTLHLITQMAGSVNFNCLLPQCARFPAGCVGEALPKAQQSRILMGPVAILWDIENCPVPGDVNAEDVAGNIRMALRVHPTVKGAVTMFSAYGDFNHFPRRLREGCQKTGVNLIDVPNGKKDASDKAILVDMFLFALDNPPPCTIFLISGDVDFAPALHKLGQRGYTIVLAIPAGVGVASALCSAGRFVWDWPSVACGQGLVPAKAFLACAGEDMPADFAGYTMGPTWHSSDDSDIPTEDEHHHYQKHIVGINHNHLFAPSGQQLTMSQGSTEGCGLAVSGTDNCFRYDCTSQRSASITLTSKCSTPLPVSMSSPYPFQNQTDNSVNVESSSAGLWVQPGDIQGLKGQLVKLLKMNGGKLLLVRLPSEYSKLFGRPLYLSEYRSSKLVHLIEKMPDAFLIRGQGSKRMLHLKEFMQEPLRHRQAKANTCMAIKEVRVNDHRCSDDIGSLRKGAEGGDDIVEGAVLVPDVESFSDDDKASDKHDTRDEEIQELEKLEFVAEDVDAQSFMAEVRLEVFKQELQELLVSHACKILLASFLTLYHQRYAHELDLSTFGVEDLELLIEKVEDVAVVTEEQGTRMRFLVARDAKADFPIQQLP